MIAAVATISTAMLLVASCGGNDSDDDAASEATSDGEVDPGGSADPWDGDACSLLDDDDVAAVFGGTAPTGSQSSAGGTVAAEDYGGSSCRWTVSASQSLFLDVYPSEEGRLDELAAYDPWDRWSVETLDGVGDDARVLVWSADSALPIAPGSVGALVVEAGPVGLRLELTAEYPGEPDGLVAAAQLILDRA